MRGTIFQIIPKDTSTRIGDNSAGVEDVDECESSSAATSTSISTNRGGGSELNGTAHATDLESNLLPRTLITKAIAHLLKKYLPSPRSGAGVSPNSTAGAAPVARAAPLTMRMIRLIALNVGIVQFLDDETGEAYTTASVFPNLSSRDVFPLSCIIKSYPDNPRWNPHDSYLGEYMAYQAMSIALCSDHDNAVFTAPEGLPTFFGAWDYLCPATGTPLFPVLLLEDLRAKPLCGITLDEWLDSPHPPPAEKLEMLPSMRASVVNTLEWVQQRCDTTHRDVNRENLLVLPRGQENAPEVVVLDWGLAATGIVVEGEAREEWDGEKPDGGGGARALGRNNRGRRWVPAVRGWGKSDFAQVEAVFDDVREEFLPIVEAEEEEEEEGSEEEQDN